MMHSPAGAIYVALHRPQPGTAVATAASIFCPPIASEHVSTERILFHAANALASRGMLAVRLAYPGNGESAGAFGDCTLRSCIDSIELVVSELRRSTEMQAVILIGMRIGALFATIAAQSLSNVAGLVSIDAITNIRRYIDELEMQGRIYTQTGGQANSADLPDGICFEAAGYSFARSLIEQLRSCSVDTLTFDGPSHAITTDPRVSRRREREKTGVDAVLLKIDDRRYWAKRDIFRLLQLEDALTGWIAGLRRKEETYANAL